MHFVQLLPLILLIFIIIVEANNLTGWATIRRQRRTLIFQTSATVKFLGGITFPVELGDRVPYRQLRCAYNMQAQYGLPTTAAQLYPPWTGRFLEEAKLKYDKFNSYVNDQSKNFLYTIFEMYLNKNGKNGRICIQKAICENSQVVLVEGVFEEIVQTILTPNKHNSDKDYYDAYEAGRFGVDCSAIYPECKQGDNFLDKITFTK